MSSHFGLLLAFSNVDLDNRGSKEADRCEQRVDKSHLPRWEVYFVLRHADWGAGDLVVDCDRWSWGALLEELEAPALLCWSGRFRFILRINQNDVLRSCGSLLRLLSRFGLRVWCPLSAAHFDLVGSVVCGVLGVGFGSAGNFNCGSVVHDERPSIEGCDVGLREGERMGG